jgi:hypothetical protein
LFSMGYILIFWFENPRSKTTRIGAGEAPNDSTGRIYPVNKHR